MSNANQEPKVFPQVLQETTEGNEELVPQVQLPTVTQDGTRYLRTQPFVRVGAEGAIYTQQRGNQVNELLASAARTASTNSSLESNFTNRGAHFIINVTALTGSPSIVVTVQGRVQQLGLYYDILVGTAITTIGTTVLKVYPGIGAIAGGAASDILPYQYRISVAHANADSITYSAYANLVV